MIVYFLQSILQVNGGGHPRASEYYGAKALKPSLIVDAKKFPKESATAAMHFPSAKLSSKVFPLFGTGVLKFGPKGSPLFSDALGLRSVPCRTPSPSGCPLAGLVAPLGAAILLRIRGGAAPAKRSGRPGHPAGHAGHS